MALAKAATQPEERTKDEVRMALDAYFDMQEEVTGTGRVDQGVKIDFWCFPREAIIEKGWPTEWFGIETKSCGLQDQRKKTACRLLHQAIKYADSFFPTPEGPKRPYLILIYPDFARILDGPDVHSTVGNTLLEGYALALAKTGGLSRILELVLPIAGTRQFEVWIHGRHRWFSSRWGRSAADYLGNRDDHASR